MIRRAFNAIILVFLLCASSYAQENVTQNELMEHLLPESLNERVPMYPPLARQARIQGRVVLSVVVDEEGKVKDVRLVSGHPMLSGSAIANAKGWMFRPFVRDEKTTEVVATITINYTLEVSPHEKDENFDHDFSWRLERARTLLDGNKAENFVEAETNANIALHLAHDLNRSLAEGQAAVLLARIHETSGTDATKDFEDALTLLRRARESHETDELSADWADAHYYAGRNYFRNKKFDLAKNALQNAMQAWLTNPPQTDVVRAQLARTASMLAAANTQLNHPEEVAFNCRILKREKRALHGLDLDEALLPCSQIH